MPEQREGYLDAYIDLLFLDRKGHGGGACTRRVLDRAQLRRILREVYERGRTDAPAYNIAER